MFLLIHNITFIQRQPNVEVPRLVKRSPQLCGTLSACLFSHTRMLSWPVVKVEITLYS